MTYNKKRMLSYGVILISVLLAYFCRLVRPKILLQEILQTSAAIVFTWGCTVPG